MDRFDVIALMFCLTAGAQADLRTAPQPASPAPSIAQPRDIPYPGVMQVAVDATDIDRRILRVHETVPVPGPGDFVLLYPEWLPGTHAPEGPLDRLAGLVVHAGGARLEWLRDTVDVHAFHVSVPPGAASLDVDFQYLSPVSRSVGRGEVSPDLLLVDWDSVVLYPAGYFTRRIDVDASLRIPDGWTMGTALETVSATGSSITFKRVPLETLVDSPVRAGRYTRTYELAPGDATPVRLDLFAGRQDLVEVKPEVLELHRSLVQQAYKLFGSHHYDHYDFLLSLGDGLGWDTTLEHHRSAEYGEPPAEFTEWDKRAGNRDVIAHEYVHSWNGKFRRPADLWTPNYNVPMRNSLLWVYEGGTEYWGKVLTARAGLWTREEALDALAMMIAPLEYQKGRGWRSVQDTTSDEIINPRRPQSWPSWQRFEDYYEEGALVWLDADTLIRERSKGARSLDDFARAFFGIENGSYTPVVYTFEDLVTALNAVDPFDWASFLRARLDAHATGAPLDGLHRGGYRLVFTETPGAYWTSVATTRTRTTDLTYSVGFIVGQDGVLSEVQWDGPAFKAGLTSGTQLVAVNGIAYDTEHLLEAVRQTKGRTEPLELLVRKDDRYRTLRIDYHEGLRYPHLERDASRPALLDEILAPRR